MLFYDLGSSMRLFIRINIIGIMNFFFYIVIYIFAIIIILIIKEFISSKIIILDRDFGRIKLSSQLYSQLHNCFEISFQTKRKIKRGRFLSVPIRSNDGRPFSSALRDSNIWIL